MNITILAGKVLEDCVLNVAKNGMEYVRLKITISKGKDVNGNYMSDIISAIFWDKKAKYISEYIHKGDLVSIEARIGVDKNKNYILTGTWVKRELRGINAPKISDEEHSLEELGF